MQFVICNPLYTSIQECINPCFPHQILQLIRIEKVLFAVKDIEGFDEIQKSLDNLKEETEKWLKTNFEQWRDQAMSLISQGDLTYVPILPLSLQ